MICTLLRPSAARQHHDDQPGLSGLPGRRHHRDQAVQQPLADAGGLTLQNNPQLPGGSASFINPTGRRSRTGAAAIGRYIYKALGGYQFPWDITASANFNWLDGERGRTGRPTAAASVSWVGSGAEYGGTTGRNLTYTTLEFQPRGGRVETPKLLELGVQKIDSPSAAARTA